LGFLKKKLMWANFFFVFLNYLTPPPPPPPRFGGNSFEMESSGLVEF